MNKKTSFLKYKFDEWARDITSLANPLILLLVPFIYLGPEKDFFSLLTLLLINEILCSLIKIFFPKKRPLNQKYTNLIEKIDAGSFPSIHSSRITITYLTLFSHSSLLVLKIVFLLVIALVMYSRIRLKKHYLIDVLGGFIIGLLLWYFFS